jgi:VanZ family protein
LSKTEEKRKWRGRVFRYAPLVFWISLILTLSGEAGAAAHTSRFLRPLLEFLFPSADPATFQFAHFLVRKLAHLSAYGLLAFFAARAFLRSSIGILADYWYAAAMAIVIFVATTDELNQYFLSSRTGTPADVAIDIIGGTLMLLVLLFFRHRTPIRWFV